MAQDSIRTALEELQAERDAARDRLHHLQKEMSTLAIQIEMLNEAIGALVSLRPDLGRAGRSQAAGDAAGVDLGSPRERERRNSFVHGTFPPDYVPALPDLPPGPERLQAFVAPGGDGKNLPSALMVASVVDSLVEPVSRDQLELTFFEYFGRSELEDQWRLPQKTFRTALRRAVERGLVVELPNGDSPMYLSGFRRREQQPAIFEMREVDGGKQ